MGLGIRSWLFFERGAGKKIKSLEFSEIFSGRNFNLNLEISAGAFGGIGPSESVFVSSMALLVKARNAFEFGTCTGLTAYNLSRHVTERVYTLDLPRQNASPKLPTENAEQEFMQIKTEDLFWNGRPGSEKIISLHGDSARFDYSPYLGKMDLVFVDASHSYEYAMNDSEKALALLGPEGVVIWHDYTPPWPGVIRALNELSCRLPLHHVRGTSLVYYLKKNPK